MAIEFDIRIIGETTAQVVEGLRSFAAHLSSGLGVGAQAANTPDMPEKANGADTPAKTTKAKKGTVLSPEAVRESAQTRLDRAAIIDGLTKIYSKGDEDVRLAITKFRDGQGADRLRDLKDDALPAAAELLTELKLAAEQPSV
jgi:hypothetical protein